MTKKPVQPLPAKMPVWDARFHRPITIKGGQLKTLRDAGDYILRLPQRTQAEQRWQTAAEAVYLAAHGEGPLMHAEIGMNQALNAKRPPPDPQVKRRR